MEGLELFFFVISHLGPNKHGLVTYIQVNVYIGNTWYVVMAQRWLNFQNWRVLKIK